MLAGLALLCAGLLAGVADGKKKHKGGGKVTVVSSQQQAILTAARSACASRARRASESGRRHPGRRLGLPHQAEEGQGREANLNLKLSAAGKSAMGSCSVDGLRGHFVKGKKEKKKGKKSAKARRSLRSCEDLAACQGRGNQGPHCDPFDPSVCLQPWPNDYFTGPMPHRYRPSARLPVRRDAAEQGRRADRPDRLQPRRWLQPRQPDHREDPAGRDAGGFRQHRASSRSPIPAPTRRRTSRRS